MRQGVAPAPLVAESSRSGGVPQGVAGDGAPARKAGPPGGAADTPEDTGIVLVDTDGDSERLVSESKYFSFPFVRHRFGRKLFMWIEHDFSIIIAPPSSAPYHQ